MAIENIGALGSLKLNLIDSNVANKTSENGSVFETFLNASSKMYDETNSLQQDVAQKQLDFATGKTDNILDVMLAQEKATTALTFTVQVTNKVIEAYKEIMSIQI